MISILALLALLAFALVLASALTPRVPLWVGCLLLSIVVLMQVLR